MINSIRFPLWFKLLTVLLVMSNLFIFGLATLLYPSLTFPDAGESAVFPIQFFAVRHIAFAFPLLFGLVRRDVKVLMVMYSIFLIMSVLDILLLGIYGYSIPILGQIPFIDQLPTLGKVAAGIIIFLLPISLGLNHLRSYIED